MITMRPTSFWQFAYNSLILAFCAALLAGIGWLFLQAIERGATLLGATLAAVATIAGASILRHFERQKELAAIRREHMGALYEHLAAVAAGEEMTPRQIQKVIVEFRRKSLVYASPAVIHAFSAWLNNLHDDDAPAHVVRENMLQYEHFILGMRVDLGVSNRGLSSGDLLRAMNTDFDDVLPPEPSTVVPPEVDDEFRVSAQSRA